METTHRIETADARNLALPEDSVDLVADPLFTASGGLTAFGHLSL